MKTLFVTDLDGTLLTGQEKVSVYSLERINRLIAAGLLFTYATARSAESAYRSTEGLALNLPAILYNGGLIYNFTTHETLRYTVFEEEWKWYVYSVLKEYGIHPLVFGALRKDRERVAYMQNDLSFGLQRYLVRRAGDKRLWAACSEEDLLAGYVFYFKCIGPREQLERAWNILKYDSRIICIFHQETYQNDFWLEISPRAATKANAVTFLRSYFACDRVVCFGDTSNDSDMFDVCEEKYAVMNADAWLKAKATGVTGYCEEDGVAKFLEARFRP